MAKTETKVLTAHVPLPLAEKVDRMAEHLERSRGWIVQDYKPYNLLLVCHVRNQSFLYKNATDIKYFQAPKATVKCFNYTQFCGNKIGIAYG
ncbi:ribbon-helix-helix domain-containing protein [Methylicorpusculum oleiharenae]|uniref:ribbon-helix-helix domain-containing protein n=1 Tax=Methylicorpusculum oleiharenae TaxID=1338687 RepID=UPI001356B2F1|nr:ribbon-helix-helix domain-containing protein [Methylicorpusculum oleiharenae]MCD2453361.1 ribbon-helix-helix domain-containing protein [Methylicorpusculum oleiharenae]